MKKKLCLVLLLCSVFLASAHEAEIHDLILLDKSAPQIIALLNDPKVIPVQELAQGWLVKTGPGLLPANTKTVGYVDYLARDSREKDYYLLLAPQGSIDLNTFYSKGTLQYLGADTWLFWGAGEHPLNLSNQAFKVKRLPESMVRPSLEVSLYQGFTPFDQVAASLDMQLVDRVEKSRLAASIQELQDFQTRFTSTPQCELAGDYLYARLSELGYLVEYDPFSFSGYSTRNILATLPGESDPEQVVIVCAHYDSTSERPYELAPGADDNASGSAAVLEIARLLKDQAFDFSIKFILFSAEEWGLYGSAHYAMNARSRGEKIVGVVNLDMIAFRVSAPGSIDLIGNKGSAWLVERLGRNLERHTYLGFRSFIDPSMRWSDHSSFWDSGYAALCGIESDFWFNPNYHKTTDTIDYLDLDFLTEVTRASLLTVAQLAQPVFREVPTPRIRECASNLVGSLFHSVKINRLQWEYQAEGNFTYDLYRSETSGSGFHKVNSLPIFDSVFFDAPLESGKNYYYKLKTVDSVGRESNFSAEVRDVNFQ